MRLTELMANASMVSTKLPADPDISGLSCDSRAVKPGFLFAALKGSQVDGTTFINDALSRGATALLMGTAGLDGLNTRNVTVPVLAEPNPRRSYAHLAAQFYRGQPPSIAAVTGTNGKSSVVSFLRQIWNLNGRSAASLGTLGIESASESVPLSLTTPDPAVIHGEFARLSAAGIDSLAIEASSHGLDQCRIDGVNVTVAGFTNISRDHLDYHGTLKKYLSAKVRLFDEVMDTPGIAVLNRDSSCYSKLLAVCRERNHRVIGYGSVVKDDTKNFESIELIDVTPTSFGLHLTIGCGGQSESVDVSLIGEFQAENLLCAIGLALADGIPFHAAVESVSRIVGVRGRMELVGRSQSGASVYVDYAHTPEALGNALRALRFHFSGRLHLVFGCGGERDEGKRLIMGRAAAHFADHVIVTDDNPRGEDAGKIRADILGGCTDAIEIADRAEAIAASVAQLDPGDMLLIAGKGHEARQILSNRSIEFDDAVVARATLGS